MEARSSFLHDSARHCRSEYSVFDFSTHIPPQSPSRHPTDVFVGFALFDELREAALHDAGRPLVHLALAVVGAADDVLDTLLPKQQITKTDCSHVGVTGLCFPQKRLKYRRNTVFLLSKQGSDMLKTVNECSSGLFFTESKSKSFSPAVNELYNQRL